MALDPTASMRAALLLAFAAAAYAFSTVPPPSGEVSFNRVSNFFICSQIDEACNTDQETVAEILDVSEDGLTVIYTDSQSEQLGFVDITDPAQPKPLGVLPLGGEPTAVAVLGNYALVGVNTSPNFVNTSGVLKVIDIASQQIVREMDLGGQPDSVASSPDNQYAAIAIENERDEDLGDGAPPQMPAGFLAVLQASGPPEAWTLTNVPIAGLPGLEFPTDPEPEYVSINNENICVLTLQENNGIVLVDLPTASVITSFTAGQVDLTQVDATEDDLIMQTESLAQVPREPDGVTWLSTDYFATADEGDLDGGSRGFTVYDKSGNVVFTSGNFLEHLVASIGHYPEARSENKGNEPENVFAGTFDGEKLLFVNSERSSVIFVYNVDDPTSPKYLQVLPAGVAPEGGIAIPSRNLAIVASEEDNREDLIRSVLNIYQRSPAPAQYPTIVSETRADGTPIPFGALSGLAALPNGHLLSIEDSFYQKSRFFFIDPSASPASLYREVRVSDSNGVFAAVTPTPEFSAEDLAALINEDGTVNVDLEGVAYSPEAVWLASEGSGTVGDPERNITSLNFLFSVNQQGAITEVVTLPAALNGIQVRYGFEGVAYDDGKLVVAFQRAWGAEPNPRLGIYDIATQEWTFAFYPLDPVESQNGGWVGLSDITPLGDMKFLVLERDNNGGPDAAIKRVYSIDLNSVTPAATLPLPSVTKTLVQDLLPIVSEVSKGLVYEKLEGMALVNGKVYIVNDNDGVDDNSGEIQLMSFEYSA